MSVTTHVLCGVGCFLEHAAFVFLGLMMMIVGLALGATIFMMPVGIVVGMLGVAAVADGDGLRLRILLAECQSAVLPARGECDQVSEDLGIIGIIGQYAAIQFLRLVQTA